MTAYDMCGGCTAGIRLAVLEGPDGLEAACVIRCHKCDLFETDEDAAGAVSELLALLHRAYVNGDGEGTVTEALSRLHALRAP